MSIFKNRVISTIAAFILTGIFIALEHFNGGVIAHHFLAREDLPEISNWWGLLTVPLLTWVTYSLISRRENIELQPNQNSQAFIRFLSALVFGISVSVLFEFRLENVLQYFIFIPFVVAIFKPVHFPEYLLGFVFGMIYTFGGILPIIIGLVFMTICFIINKFIYLLKTLLVSTSSKAN